MMCVNRIKKSPVKVNSQGFLRISDFGFLSYYRLWFDNCHYSHSLKLALYRVNLGLSARFFGGFNRLFPLYLWSLRKNGIKMVSRIPPGKRNSVLQIRISLVWIFICGSLLCESTIQRAEQQRAQHRPYVR